MAAEARPSDAWTVVAALRHRPGQPTIVELVARGPWIDVDAWSRSEGWCEHCRARRARRATYLLRRGDGRLVQLGSSCVSKFTAQAQPLTMPTGGVRVRSPRRTRPAAASQPVEYIDTLLYLAHVAQVTRDLGFVPSSAATRMREATWSLALGELDRGRPPGARACRRATEALSWVRRDLLGATEFERRLVSVLSADRLTRRELPTAAAGIYAYHQHLRREIRARRKSASG